MVLALPEEGFEGIKGNVVFVKEPLEEAQPDPNPEPDLVVLAIAPENGAQ